MENRENDRLYMHRCLQLAACGRGRVSPNPMVGAVIVCDGRIIGEGYHRQFGGPHAEVNAVNSVRESGLLPLDYRKKDTPRRGGVSRPIPFGFGTGSFYVTGGRR